MLKVRALCGDRRGITAVEFALTAPVVALLIIAAAEIGLILTGGLMLEAGARAAGRFGQTGIMAGEGDGANACPLAAGSDRLAYIRQVVTQHVCPADLADDVDAESFCFWASDAQSTEDASDDGAISPLIITTRAYTDPRNFGEPEPYADAAPANGRFDEGEDYDDVNCNGRWDPDMGIVGAGGASDLVVYRLEMPQRIYNPLLKAAVGDLLWHESQVVVRNEAF